MVTADDQTKTYGQTHELGYDRRSRGGPGQRRHRHGRDADQSPATPRRRPVGNYAIVARRGRAPGCPTTTSDYVNGTLTVNTKALKVTAGDQTKIYGQTVTPGPPSSPPTAWSTATPRPPGPGSDRS